MQHQASKVAQVSERGGGEGEKRVESGLHPRQYGAAISGKIRMWDFRYRLNMICELALRLCMKERINERLFTRGSFSAKHPARSLFYWSWRHL